MRASARLYSHRLGIEILPPAWVDQRATVSSNNWSWLLSMSTEGESTVTLFKWAGGPIWPIHDKPSPSHSTGTLFRTEEMTRSSLRAAQSTPKTSNSSADSGSSGWSWLPRIPRTSISNPNISAGDRLGPSRIWMRCWFHDSAKNDSCWLMAGKKRKWRSQMWQTLTEMTGLFILMLARKDVEN